MAISWTAKRQLSYFLYLLIIVIGITGFFAYTLFRPTCSDGRQNQREAGIDCGGPCSKKCLGEVRDLISHWSKVVKVKDGVYDAAALIENPNLSAGAGFLKYRFRLYDSAGVLVISREGETYANPGERFVIFEPNIEAGRREPKTANIEFDPKIPWQRMDAVENNLIVTKKDFANDPLAQMKITVKNKSMSAASNIQMSAVLYGADEKIMAVSNTQVDYINGDESRDIIFTWPQPFAAAPATSEFFIRVAGKFNP